MQKILHFQIKSKTGFRKLPVECQPGLKDAPFISIELHPKDINKVFKLLCDHKIEFSCDTLYKELRSLIKCQDHWSLYDGSGHYDFSR